MKTQRIDNGTRILCSALAAASLVMGCRNEPHVPIGVFADTDAGRIQVPQYGLVNQLSGRPEILQTLEAQRMPVVRELRSVIVNLPEIPIGQMRAWVWPREATDLPFIDFGSGLAWTWFHGKNPDYMELDIVIEQSGSGLYRIHPKLGQRLGKQPHATDYQLNSSMLSVSTLTGLWTAALKRIVLRAKPDLEHGQVDAALSKFREASKAATLCVGIGVPDLGIRGGPLFVIALQEERNPAS